MTALLFLAMQLASAETLVVNIDGMNCISCEGKLTEALEAVPEVSKVTVSFDAKGACVAGKADRDAVQQAIAAVGPYEIASIESVERCPPRMVAGDKTNPWLSIPEGLDAEIISFGKEVDLAPNLAAGKFTIVDFGAPWCGPCHEVAAELKTYLGAHDDVAVRAITLDADTPKVSFNMPAAQQHLKFAGGLPYLLVFDAHGKRIYKGGDLKAATAAIEKKR